MKTKSPFDNLSGIQVSKLLRVASNCADDGLANPHAKPMLPQSKTKCEQSDSDSEFFPGQVIEGYEIVAQIGHGGMCLVYEAREIRLHRTVALKVLRPEVRIDPAIVDAFMEEALIIASLEHPNIISIYAHHDQTEEHPAFFTMPYIRTGSLQGFVERNGPLTVLDSLHIIRQIAQALEYAHARDVLHRDITARNILLDGKFVRVADFGISSANLSELRSKKTSGSLEYMPPEQMLSHPQDARSDIYSLGVNLFYMLTGKRPAGTISPQTIRKDLPDAIDLLTQSMLASEPSRRPSSCTELIGDIDAILFPSPQPNVLRRPRILALIVLIILSAGSIVAFLHYG